MWRVLFWEELIIMKRYSIQVDSRYHSQKYPILSRVPNYLDSKSVQPESWHC